MNNTENAKLVISQIANEIFVYEGITGISKKDVQLKYNKGKTLFSVTKRASKVTKSSTHTIENFLKGEVISVSDHVRIMGKHILKEKIEDKDAGYSQPTSKTKMLDGAYYISETANIIKITRTESKGKTEKNEKVYKIKKN